MAVKFYRHLLAIVGSAPDGDGGFLLKHSSVREKRVWLHGSLGRRSEVDDE